MEASSTATGLQARLASAEQEVQALRAEVEARAGRVAALEAQLQEVAQVSVLHTGFGRGPGGKPPIHASLPSS